MPLKNHQVTKDEIFVPIIVKDALILPKKVNAAEHLFQGEADWVCPL